MNAYDIETYVDKNTGYFIPFCCCFKINNLHYSFYYDEKKPNVILDSINFIIENFEGCIIYVHNINFDGFLIIDEISKTEIEIDCLIREMNIYRIVLKNKNKKFEFRCSYKIIPDSLKNIAKSFNIGKKDIFPHKFSSKENMFYKGTIPSSEFFLTLEDYLNFKQEKDIFDFKEECIKYCKNDVIITSEFMKIISAIVKEFNIDISNCYSAPSLSLKIFIKNFNKNRISLNLKNKIDLSIRKSYFGGKCEVYGNPEWGEFIHYFDFSGMYGQCMEQKFPYGKIEIDNNPKDFKKIGFYFIEYESNMEYPILPHKSILDGKLLFTNGKDRGIFWFEEILLFLEYGGKVKKIFFSINFSKFDYLFKDFVQYFNNIKKISDVHKKFGKLMINSLYGRLGMDYINTEFKFIKKNDFNYYEKEKEILNYRILNNIILLEIKSNDIIKTNNNVALASAISSKARIKLYKAQMDVIKNGGKLLYSDTDSIFASYKKDFSLEKHGEVDWSKEKKKIKNAVFISSKTYALKFENEQEIKVKGFDLKNIKFEEILESFYNELDIENQEKSIKKKNLKIYLDYNKKILKLNNYSKRIFDKNKKNTRPLEKIDDFNYI